MPITHAYTPDLTVRNDESVVYVLGNEFLDGVTRSPFANNGGAFYGADNGSVTQMSDSLVSPGTHTRVHSTGHSVLEGDVVTHTTFANANYNGTFTAVNVSEDSTYDIPVVFAATGTGAWAYSSVDQTDPRLTVLNCDPSPDSKTNGAMTGGGAVLTTITTTDIFVPLNLNGTAVVGSTNERFSLTDTTTGELTYIGLRDFEGVLIAHITSQASAAEKSFAFRAIKNGSPLPDAIQAHVEVGSDFAGVTLITPISLSTGDEVILEVANTDDTEDVEINFVSLSIR